MTNPQVPGNTTRPQWIRWFRWAMAVSVGIAVIYTAVKTSGQLHDSNFRLREVNLFWWVAAVLVYMLTMTLAWAFWHRVLSDLGQHAPRQKTLLAFFASQLGKYVPGKAMVVVVRTDIIRGPNVQTAPAAASVFVETLTWLFVGSAIGCLLVMVLFRDKTGLLISAGMLMVVAGVLTSPPVFRRITDRVASRMGRNSHDSAHRVPMFDGLDWSTMLFGWCVLTIGWCLNGLSLWLVLYGMIGNEITVGDYPLTLACVCLATVAGFVSLLPGGIGVRELVMIPLLGSRFGPVTAVVAAVVIRLVWLTAELVSAGLMLLISRRR